MSLAPPLHRSRPPAGEAAAAPRLPQLGPHRRHDYQALPETPRCELICGRFVLSPSHTLLHQFVMSQLVTHLDVIARRHGGMALAAPFDVPLAVHSVVQPDVVYLRREALARIERGGDAAPDLVVEVLSPGTARRDRGVKQALYASCGITEYWLVDAAVRSIEFLVNQEGRFIAAPLKGTRYRSPALSEVRLDVAAYWRRVEKRARWAFR
jgi:Uma2 family endonuclease